MRGDIFAVGAVLLLCGILMFIPAYHGIREYEILASEWGGTVTHDEGYFFLLIKEGVGIFMSIIGLILTVVGAATTKEQTQKIFERDLRFRRHP